MPRGRRYRFKARPYALVTSDRAEIILPSADASPKLRARLERMARTGQMSPWTGDWVGLDFEGLPWTISTKVAHVNGVWQIVGLRIEPQNLEIQEVDGRERLAYTGPTENAPTITADVLRELPLNQLRRMGAEQQSGRDPLEPLVVVRPSGGWGDDHYRAVAREYRNADRAPLKAIQERWRVSRATASKWVHEARERGFLGYPPRRGVAGASEPISPVKPKKKRGQQKGRPTR